MRSTPRWIDRAAANAAALCAAYRVGLASALAAWPVMLGRAIFYGVCLMVLVAFWDKVGSQRLAGTLATRLPREGFGVYVGITEWITLSVTAIQLRLEDEIRSGALEPHLLRPKPYLTLTIAGEFGNMSARLLVLGAAGLAILALSGKTAPPPIAFVYIAVLGVAGAAVGVMLYALVGLTAFWLRKVLPALLIMQKLMFILGGLFAPISLYPAWLHAIAAASPFGAHLAFAGQAALSPSAADFWRALGAQAFWLTALALAAALVWRAGLAKLMRGDV
jgi:ABC-2 type transport system permease protein